MPDRWSDVDDLELDTHMLVSTGHLPADTDVQSLLEEGHARYRSLGEGVVADYIPALACASPEWFGAAIVGTRGAVFQVGDAMHEFSIQSVSKPFVFALVVDALGADEARRRLGVNSTGLPFNSVMAIELGATAPSTRW